jgi:hypothetical protein
MVPLGKQQELSSDLSTSSPEELSGSAGRLFIEDRVIVVSNEKSARLWQFGVCIAVCCDPENSSPRYPVT